MKRIYDRDAKLSLRNYTVTDLQALKSKLTQTTANSTEEAATAREAGLDLIMGNAQNKTAVRKGAPDMFFTAAIGLPDNPTGTDTLAREEVPVMCHLGLVPPKSTWRGGLCATSKTGKNPLIVCASTRHASVAGNQHCGTRSKTPLRIWSGK